MTTPSPDRIKGILLGTLVGDALGLPAEGLRPATIHRRGWQGNWKHRFVFGRGMASDDTEHTIMLCQALLGSQGNPTKLATQFASELRWWILGLPAGVGLATARSCLRLWFGVCPMKAGVFSAGNGPCMRTAIIGVLHPNDPTTRCELTTTHTRITHTDPKALIATLAVTELAALLANSDRPPDPETILECITPESPDPEWLDTLEALKQAWSSNADLPTFLTKIGANPTKGISGYAYRTVPAVIFAGVRHDWDFNNTLVSILDAGGDTDTTAAIAGALCGAFGGETAIPPAWLDGVKEWPVTTRKVRELATALTQNRPMRIRARWSPALLVRNLAFLIIVLVHGFGRLIPSIKRPPK